MPIKVIETETSTSSSVNPDGTVTFPLVIVQSPLTQYPAGSIALQSSSGNVANAAAVATLTSAVSVTAYLSGLELTASGATAGLPVVATVTGLLGGTRSIIFTFPAGVLVAAEPIIVKFNPALQASAANTNIVVTLPAGGAGNTNAAASAEGYR